MYHPEYKGLEKAAAKIDEVASYVNDLHGENLTKMVSIQMNFGVKVAKDLVVPSRSFVKEAKDFKVLLQVPRNLSGKYSERKYATEGIYVVLFSDILVYGKSEKMYVGQIPLLDLWIRDLQDINNRITNFNNINNNNNNNNFIPNYNGDGNIVDGEGNEEVEEYKNLLQLYTRTGERLTLVVPDVNEKFKWIQDICNAITNIIEKKKSMPNTGERDLEIRANAFEKYGVSKDKGMNEILPSEVVASFKTKNNNNNNNEKKKLM